MRIGLLPLYLELYDRALPRMRAKIDRFHEKIAGEFRRRRVEVVTAPACRRAAEFAAAIRAFEKRGVDALVTLHLAYSPSLESAAALAGTNLPVIVLDTTPSFDFGPGQDPDELLFNHGIHGVQDMCNLFVRAGRPFKIEAGHWEKSDALDRVCGWLTSARAAVRMRNARIGRIGRSFEGMGDFAVADRVLRETVGATVVQMTPAVMKRLLNDVRDKEVAAEMTRDRRQFEVGKIDAGVHRRTTLTSLAIRDWIERESLTAFTMNFLAVTKASGIPAVPFLEAGKAMARGIGYAGEGDTLTAGLAGALAGAFTEVSFTEMFCPDWKGGSVMLSHMGEVNVRLLKGRGRLEEFEFPYTDAGNPGRVVGMLKPGRASLVNLAPVGGGRYRLIVGPVTMLDAPKKNRMNAMIHGWFRPPVKVADYLEAYSRAGGTHHGAVVYGDHLREIKGFGEFMGWDVVEIA